MRDIFLRVLSGFPEGNWQIFGDKFLMFANLEILTREFWIFLRELNESTELVHFPSYRGDANSRQDHFLAIRDCSSK